MSKTGVLQKSAAALLIFKVIYVGSYVLLLGLVTTWFINREVFHNIDFSSGFYSGFGITSIHLSEAELPASALQMSTVTTTMMLWFLLRNSLFFVIGWLVLRRISSIVKSIESLEMFYSGNIENFQKLARLCFVIVAVSCFNFYWSASVSRMDITFPIIPVLFGLGCLLLAEVFKEGKSLNDDKNSIV